MFRFTLLLLISFAIQAQPGGASPVKIAEVQKVSMAPERKIPATIEAKYIATIKSEYKGTITEIADVGSLVKSGDMLVNLIDTQVELMKQELEAEVESNQAKLDFAASENTRLTNLSKQNMVSSSELEQNKSDLVTAKNDLKQSQSRLEQHLDQMQKLRIVAPYDGVVMSHLAQPGQLVNAGNDVVEFMQANKLEVVVHVPFTFKSQIQSGSFWKVETLDNKTYDAEIIQFVPAATGSSHTIEVRLLLNSTDLWAGEAVNVLVPTQAKQEVIAVPRDALVIRNNGIFVYTVVEGKAHKVDVIPGMAQGEMIQVKGLLSEGDEVIIRGNERIRPEQEVQVIN